jgi:hypothetical protein
LSTSYRCAKIGRISDERDTVSVEEYAPRRWDRNDP